MNWLEWLLIINIVSIAINIFLYLSSKKKLRDAEYNLRDAEKNLNDAEYKRWQVIHHHYVQKEIEEGKERLTLLHPFIREHGGCKGNKNIWYD